MKTILMRMFLILFDRTRGSCKYLFGAKPDPHEDSNNVRHADCSGWVRWIIARCTGAILPEGSDDQHTYFETNGYHKLDRYSDIWYAKGDPNRLFIAFIPPQESIPGHVWFVYMGRTYECHGGVGVDSRPWNTGILLNGVKACYELPCSDTNISPLAQPAIASDR